MRMTEFICEKFPKLNDSLRVEWTIYFTFIMFFVMLPLFFYFLSINLKKSKVNKQKKNRKRETKLF